jgi:hypothetical protein
MLVRAQVALEQLQRDTRTIIDAVRRLASGRLAPHIQDRLEDGYTRFWHQRNWPMGEPESGGFNHITHRRLMANDVTEVAGYLSRRCQGQHVPRRRPAVGRLRMSRMTGCRAIHDSSAAGQVPV